MKASPFSIHYKADQFCLEIKLMRPVQNFLQQENRHYESKFLKHFGLHFFKENPYATVADLLNELSITNKGEGK